jgi:hypothetical protein
MALQLPTRWVKNLPLVGPLADCTWDDHWESLGQLTVVFGLSTAPIWLGALIVYGTGGDLGYPAFVSALSSMVANGELFMYCTALLAPVFWMALFDPPGARAFPSKVPHMFLIAIIDLLAAMFFGLISAHSNVNPRFIVAASRFLFWASLILLYLGTVYHTSRLPEPSEEFRKQEDAFSSALNEHRQ